MKSEKAVRLIKQYIKEKEGRDNLTLEDGYMVQALIEGEKYTECRRLCEERYGINLMADCAFMVIREVYGETAIARMKPKTIFKKIQGLMQMVEGTPDEENIQEIINDYLDE